MARVRSMVRPDCPLTAALIDVIRSSKHINALERAGFEKVLTNPLFGASELSIEAILTDFLVRVNTDSRATENIGMANLGRILGEFQ